MDSRGVTPVVEKVVTMGLVVLFVGGMTATLFGTTVPTYRDAVGTEMGERVLATVTQDVEQSIPPDGAAVRSRTAVDLPATIRDAGYDVRADGESLVLDHPDPDIGGRARLALPPSVARVAGEWDSGSDTVVSVRSVDDGLAVELAEAER